MDNCSNRVPPDSIVASAVLGLGFLFGVPGNITALVILLQRLKNDNMAIKLTLSLAVSDLLTVLLLPVWIWALMHGWAFGSVACKLLAYVIYCCTCSSAISVTLLSMQRYMQVLHSQRWSKLGKSGQRGLLCGTWLVSGVLISYTLVQHEVGCDNGLLYCYPFFKSDIEKVAIAIFENTLVLVLFSLLVYFYYSLHRGVNESPFFSGNRMTTLIIRIVVVFFICTFVLFISNILVIVTVLLKMEHLSKSAELCVRIAKALVCINSCLKPFLYAFSLRSHCSVGAENTSQALQVHAP